MGTKQPPKSAKGVCQSCKRKGRIGSICAKCRQAFEAVAEVVVNAIAANANLGGDS